MLTSASGRDQRDHRGLVREVGGVQDAERRAGVPDVSEVEQPGNRPSRCRAAAAARARAPSSPGRPARRRRRAQREGLETHGRPVAAPGRPRSDGAWSGPSRPRLRQRLLAAVAEALVPRSRCATAGTYRQQRSQRTPSARATAIVAQLSSPSRYSAVSGVRAFSRGREIHLRHDEERRQVRPVALEQLEERAARPQLDRASSDLPTIFAWRSFSISTFTASRSAISRSHALDQRRRPRAPREPRRNSRRGAPTSSRSPGRCRHSSSAVTGRIGAISRARPSAIDVHRRLRRAPGRATSGASV